MSQETKSKTTRLLGRVEKAWGHEFIYISTELYCMKSLNFSKAGNKFSMHFHKIKDESWYVAKGSFILRSINLTNAAIVETTMNTFDSVRILPFTIHQLEALEDDSIVLESSTADSVEDNYRVMPGDSQRV